MEKIKEKKKEKIDRRKLGNDQEITINTEPICVAVASGSGSVRGRRRRGLGGVGALRGGGSGGLGRGDTGMPSRWYTLLALPFPDQHLGRRDLTARRGTDHPYSFGLSAAHRAGYFSNPSL